MKVKFCGAARDVTGSAHLLTLDDGFKILLDCGLYQGSSEKMKNFNEKWLFDPEEINCVVLSHAHIDHCGRLPKLVKDGFKGSIFCTHATRSLCSIMLLDSALIQERDADYFNKRRGREIHEEREALYDKEDVKKTMERFVSYGYGRKFEVYSGVEVEFRDAGQGAEAICPPKFPDKRGYPSLSSIEKTTIYPSKSIGFPRCLFSRMQMHF